MANRKFDGIELQKRLKKVLIPYVFFSVIAILYHYKTSIANGLFNTADLLNIAILFLVGASSPIYYFIFIICYIYIIFYLVRKWNFSFLHVFLFFLTIAILHHAYFKQLTYKFNIDRESQWFTLYSYRTIIWPVFFFMGVYMREINLLDKLKAHRKFIFILWLITFTGLNFAYFTGLNGIDGYNSIFGMIYSITTTFVLLLLNIQSKFIKYISGLSFYLYLSHIFVVYIIWNFAQSLGLELPFWFSIVSFLLSLIIPIIFYEIQKKIFKDKLSKVLGS